MSEEQFRLKDVAAALGCSARQCLQLVDAGFLPAFDVGAGSKRRSLRVPRAAVEAFIRERGINGVGERWYRVERGPDGFNSVPEEPRG